jgi:hypothetical protein
VGFSHRISLISFLVSAEDEGATAQIQSHGSKKMQGSSKSAKQQVNVPSSIEEAGGDAEADAVQDLVVIKNNGADPAIASDEHQQLQSELKKQAQGHATAVIRALKEMTVQRKIMEQTLEKIAKYVTLAPHTLSISLFMSVKCKCLVSYGAVYCFVQ